METTRIENNRDLDNLYYCINCYYKYKKYNLDINILKKNKDKHANNFFALLSLIGGSFIFSKEIVSYPGLVILDGEVFVINLIAHAQAAVVALLCFPNHHQLHGVN